MASDSSQPRLSVVVVSFDRGLHLLKRCLEALVDQQVPGGLEIIVVRARSAIDAHQREMEADFADVAFLRAAAHATIPEMRCVGVARSRGEVVALIEDDCLVAADWTGSVLRAHGSRHVAVGGAVEPGAYRSPLDWAAYVCDYGRFMLPFKGGDTWALPGNNVSYKRSVIPELLAMTAREGLQEVFVHEQWHEEGKPMLADPAIVVRNEHRWNTNDVLCVPFFHARAFGARRARAWGIGRRGIRAFATLGLPPIHIARSLQRVLSRRRGVLRTIGALPWIGVFGLSWAAGECLGYMAGPGDSLRRWR